MYPGTEPIDRKLKAFSRTMVNRADISEYIWLLFSLLFIKAACSISSEGGIKKISVPNISQWKTLKAKHTQPLFWQELEKALKAIEDSNPDFSCVFSELPGKNQAKSNLPIVSPVFCLVDSLSELPIDETDIFGHVYERLYAGGIKDGKYLTNQSVAALMAEILDPHEQGTIYDPCCGSGSMFVQAIKHLSNKENAGKGETFFYGQESNHTLSWLSKLNLALRGVKTLKITFNNDGSLINDAFPGLKADYIFANPPFNGKAWGQKQLKNDPRWKYGLPPKGNANYAWIQHILFHLAPGGKAAIILPMGSLASNSSELQIRKNIIEAGIIDCIISLPPQLFRKTRIPACIWIFSSKTTGSGNIGKANEILFINASDMGTMVDRAHRILTHEDIQKISGTYRAWAYKKNEW